MCYFITVGVQQGNVGLFQGSVPRGMKIHATCNQSITRRLGDNVRTFLLTRGMCSCDLFGPAAACEPIEIESIAARRIREYRKKGWSEAKTRRAVEAGLPKRAIPPETPGYISEVRELLADLAEQMGELTVVVHFYDEDIETGKLKIADGPTVSTTSFREGRFAPNEDEVLHIKAHRGA